MTELSLFSYGLGKNSLGAAVVMERRPESRKKGKGRSVAEGEAYPCPDEQRRQKRMETEAQGEFPW